MIVDSVIGKIAAREAGFTDIAFASAELGVAVGDRVMVEADGNTATAEVIDTGRAFVRAPIGRVGHSCIVRLPRAA